MATLGVERTALSLDVLGRFVCATYDEALRPGLPPGTPAELAGVASDVAPFDAIVIGSGMYGAYAAARLYRLGAKVLVLEAGPFFVSEHYQNLSVSGFQAGEDILALDSTQGIDGVQGLVWGQPWRGQQIFRRQAFCVGGKALFWGGWAPRLTDDVLAGPLSGGGHASWPAATVAYLNDPTHGYERTELEMGVKERTPNPANPANPAGPRQITPFTDFFNDPANPLNQAILSKAPKLQASYPIQHASGSSQTVIQSIDPAPIAVQAEAPTAGLFSFDKFSSLTLLEEAVRDDIDASGVVDQRRRLFVVPNAKVTRLTTQVDDNSTHRIISLELLGLPSIPVAPTTQVVLALGCIESTRLALDSFGHIQPLANHMGRNLMAHLRNNVTLRVRRSALGLRAQDALEMAAFHVVGLSPTGARYHLQFYAGSRTNAPGDATLYRMVTDLDVLEELERNRDPEWVGLTFRACAEMVGRIDLPAGNDAASYVDLSTSTDPFGQGRRAWVNLVQQPNDKLVFDEIDQVIFALARKLAVQESDVELWDPSLNDNAGDWVTFSQNPFAVGQNRYGKLAQGEGGIRDGLGTTWHESGTLWLGAAPNDSVLDPSCRFHQVRNAWCVDQAAFPRGGSANPVPTGITLARLAAERIVERGLELVEPRDATGRAISFAHRPEAEFSGLFTFRAGTDLPLGWRFFGQGTFRRFGAVLESSGGIGLLCFTAQNFRDFTLRLQYRSPTLQNNSGVYVRVPSRLEGNLLVPSAPPKQLALRGYEIQVDNVGQRDVPGESGGFFNPFHQTGAVYPVHPTNEFQASDLPAPNGARAVSRIPSRPLGEWNDLEVRVGGNRIRILLNGTPTLEGGDFVDQKNRYPEGLIALQTHFKGFRVQYRHLRIREGNPFG